MMKTHLEAMELEDKLEIIKLERIEHDFENLLGEPYPRTTVQPVSCCIHRLEQFGFDKKSGEVITYTITRSIK